MSALRPSDWSDLINRFEKDDQLFDQFYSEWVLVDSEWVLVDSEWVLVDSEWVLVDSVCVKIV